MKCPNCNAVIDADPGTPTLTCQYCGVRVENRKQRGTDNFFDKIFEDKDGDGIPDMLQGDFDGAAAVSTVKKSAATTYEVNGRTYHSLEEMPEADRRLFEGAGAMFTGFGNGGPADMHHTADTHTVHRSSETVHHAKPAPSTQAREPASGSSKMWMVLAVLFIVIGVVIGLILRGG